MSEEKFKLIVLYSENGIPDMQCLEYHPIWTSFHFPFPVCVQCYLTDLLPLSIPCMLAVFPHRPHHHLLVHWAYLYRVVLQVSASRVCACICICMYTHVVLRPLTGDAHGLLVYPCPFSRSPHESMEPPGTGLTARGAPAQCVNGVWLWESSAEGSRRVHDPI